MKNIVLKGALLSLSVCLGCGSALLASENAHAVHWGYEGHGGPSHWGELKPEFERCSNGDRQSPINIDTTQAVYTKKGSDVEVKYIAAPLNIVNNGHTIQVNSDKKSTVMLGGKEYTLLQYHFHAGSEHTLDGKQHAMEVHLVHQSEDGELGVIGVFMDIGKENAFIKQVFDAMPTHAGETKTSDKVQLNAIELLPVFKNYYHYLGSLTTPPCTQIVEWYVMQDAITISKEQLAQFETLYAGNFRPTQPLGARKLLKK
jgi:carbonic anhydrase